MKFSGLYRDVYLVETATLHVTCPLGVLLRRRVHHNAEWTSVLNSGVCDLFTNMDYGGIKDWSGEEHLLAMEGGSGTRHHVRQTGHHEAGT